MKKRKELLKSAYQKVLEVGLGNRSIDDLSSFVENDVMGYGTALDEKIMSMDDFIALVHLQRKQAVNFDDFYFTSNPVLTRFTDNDNTGIIVDEIELVTVIKNDLHKMNLRMTAVFELREETWKLIHWHASKAEHVSAGEDPWHLDEWKKKNAELRKAVEEKTADLVNKNRELEIEAALERVRVVAMSMNKSEDLLNICEITFKELDKLGFDHLRNAVIHIPNDGQKYFMDYDFSEFTGGAISKIKYGLHPIVDEYSEKIRATSDAYFEVVIDKDQLDGWKDFRQKSGQIDDPRLDDADAIHYYLFSIGIGDIGISTFRPSNDSQIKILKRFRNVFDLAYKRYNDIALAEAQAREAQIEAALERVRSSAMAMHKSEDLSSSVGIVLSELDQLGFNTVRCGIGIFNDKSRKVNVWTASSSEIYISGDEVLEGHPLLEGIYDAWQNQVDFTYVLEGEELLDYYKVVGESNLPVSGPEVITGNVTQHYYLVIFPAGGLFAFRESEFSDEVKQLMKRFGDVFNLAFTRHLDLKKAEAQAREAKIEAGLERARAQSMMMQQSDELNKTAHVFHEQLSLLGINSEFSYLWLPDEVKNEHIFWATWQDGEKGADLFNNKQVIYPLDKSEPAIAECYLAWESGMPVHVNPVPPSDVNAYFNTWSELLEGVEKFKPELYPDGLYYVDAYMKYGCFGIMTKSLLTEDEQQILSRFTKEFERAYTRFLDLKKAEAQARESQIELSLERIRAQVTAMKESSELLDIVVTMRTEFVSLGHEAHYFWHMRYLPNKYEKAMTSGDGTRIGMVMTLPRHIHGDIKLLADWEKSDDPTVIFAMDVETAVAYVDKMINLGDFQQVDPNAPTLDDIRHIGGLTFIMARTSHGEIGYSLPGVVTDIPGEDLTTITRFAAVFDLAYRRFEDLKNSERRNRESQVELALERVRARTMAMQKSNELAQTAAHLFSQLNELGINPYRCNIAIVNKEQKNCRLWSTTNSGNVIPTVSALPLHEYPVLMEMFEGWESQKQNHIIKLAGQDRFLWSQYISKHLPFEEYKPHNIDIEMLLKEAAYFSNFYFRQGFFTIHSKVELTQDQLNIVQRFANVFEQTYTRFLDLENAEKQNKLIQAENERKTEELEEARQLQLAMLPKELPKLSNLDIAVYMKTATEVGGDYYDFHVDAKNNFTAIIGDATGHGMKAGTMVTITKSLFNSLASSKDILKTFKRISEVIKNMKFRQLSMCLQMIKISGSEFSMSSAAMPPAFIYRKSDNSVEEILLSGMPLGAMLNFRYKVEKRTLNEGDVIFLLSDGLPELHNDKKHMYGYDRVKTELVKVGRRSSEEIIEHFEKSAVNWLNGSEQDDDVTFVVIKIK